MKNCVNEKFDLIDPNLVKKVFWFASYLCQKSELYVCNINISIYGADLFIADFYDYYEQFSIYYDPKKRYCFIETGNINDKIVKIYIQMLWEFANENYKKGEEPDFKLNNQIEGVKSIETITGLICPIHSIKD